MSEVHAAALVAEPVAVGPRLAPSRLRAFTPEGCASRRTGRQILAEADISRVIKIASEDRRPFEAIESQFGLNASGVVKLMRTQMTPSSFRM